MANPIRILLICDEEEICRQLREQLIAQEGYSVSFEVNGADGIEAMRRDVFNLVIIKTGMQDMPVAGLFNAIKKIDPHSIIIGITGHSDTGSLMGAEDSPFFDFITVPINPQRVSFLLKKGIEAHEMIMANQRIAEGFKERNISLEKQNTILAQRIEESTRNLTKLYEDLRLTYMRTIKVLAQAIDARDHYTHSHSENVAKYAVAIAMELGLSAKDIELIREACELHDLGKIGISDSILSKESELSPQEWVLIKRHPQTAAQILEPLTFLHDVTELIRQHHEHYDGSGYPDGRKSEDILLGARIIHLADAYESMRSARSYRKIPLSKEEAIQEIKVNTGTQFDPVIVKAFLEIVDKL